MTGLLLFVLAVLFLGMAVLIQLRAPRGGAELAGFFGSVGFILAIVFLLWALMVPFT